MQDAQMVKDRKTFGNHAIDRSIYFPSNSWSISQQ